MTAKTETPSSSYYALFAHMSEEHDLTLVDSELEDICRVVEKMRVNPELAELRSTLERADEWRKL